MIKKVFNITEEIAVKRFYFDGKIETACPSCKSKMTHNFNENYLSYPNPPEEMNVYFYCDKCKDEYEMPGKLEAIKVEVSYDLEKLEKI